MNQRLLQLDPPIPMVTPRGKGLALVLHDFGCEFDNLWTVAQDSGEIWTWQNREVRMQSNVTMGRAAPELPESR